MPLTREQIKHAPVSPEKWVEQRTQVGGLWFDPLKIKPLTDHILIEIDPPPAESELIEAPQIAVRDIGTRIGTVIAVGPGKWKEKPGLSYEITRERFYPTSLKPGDRVIIGHYSDWESWFADYEGRGRNVVLCQEADVRVVIDVIVDCLTGVEDLNWAKPGDTGSGWS
jgi:co-chaperonin GroES (HSP10)